MSIDLKTGRLAKSTDPAIWDRFKQVLAYCQSGKTDGIGFVFTPEELVPPAVEGLLADGEPLADLGDAEPLRLALSPR